MLKIGKKSILNSINEFISDGGIYRVFFNTGAVIVHVLCGVLIYYAIKINNIYDKMYLMGFVMLAMMIVHIISYLANNN